MFDYVPVNEQLFEVARRTFDTPAFRGMTFIEVEAKTVINRAPPGPYPFRWTLNPYRGCSHSCSYCFARATHAFLDMNSGRDFETKIVVKINAPEVLRRQLRARAWKGEHIAMGTATDPYQRAEGRYRLMPAIIRELTEYRNPFSILTKGTLLMRDLELLREAADVTEVSTAFAIGTLDQEVWRKSEPGTPPPKERMAALRALNAAGIPCGVMVAPILPGISDRPEQLRAVVEAALDARATFVSPIVLHLRPGVREEYLAWLKRAYPDLVERTETLYGNGAYAPRGVQASISMRVTKLLPQRPPRHQRETVRPRARQLSLL